MYKIQPNAIQQEGMGAKKVSSNLQDFIKRLERNLPESWKGIHIFHKIISYFITSCYE